MDFITENYIWFIVGGVVVLMAIIGYIADKTDFGRKWKTEKVVEKKKKKNKESKPTKIEVDAKGINELSQDVAEKNFKNSENEVNNDVSFTPPLTDNVQPTVNDQQFTTPTANETVDQSLFVPLTEQSDQAVNNDTTTNDNSVVRNNTVSEIVNEEPQNSEDNQVEELQNINPTNLPETTDKKENEVVSEDEDIWKF